MTNYGDFISQKVNQSVNTESIQLTADDLNPMLYRFQRDIVRWALAKGRAAIFADCGLGKTPMQLEWAAQVHKRMGGCVLILAPLAVSSQTVAEGIKFGVDVTLCEKAEDLKPGINITNYEKLDKFSGCHFTGVVLDESSILKSFTGKVRNQIIISGNRYGLGREVPLQSVSAWANMTEEASISKLEKPLFSYFRIPGANTIDSGSPLGLSVFANAIHELKSLDIAISRKDSEVEDSKHITFVGQQLIQSAQNRGLTLPRFVKGLGMGVNDGDTSAIHEHVPTLLTDQRIKDINFDLSLVGVKCGFSEGVFVMDGQTGMITATQVESDDRDTIQTIKADRDALKDALTQAFYGANALATMYGMAPLGEYEINYNFGDITYNYEEDKAAWRSYVTQGWVPRWLYFVKFEGMSQEDAKAMTAEAEAANLEARCVMPTLSIAITSTWTCNNRNTIF